MEIMTGKKIKIETPICQSQSQYIHFHSAFTPISPLPLPHYDYLNMHHLCFSEHAHNAEDKCSPLKIHYNFSLTKDKLIKSNFSKCRYTYL